VLLEGEVAFTVNGEVLDMKGPALVRVPPGAIHNVTTLGTGRNKLIAFFSSNDPGAAPADGRTRSRTSRQTAPASAPR
jgi:mannose-6-phosphate isomerase-like protein (cupin superfamily)